MRLSEAYSILNIPESSSKEEAKKAFRKLAAKYHPDVCKEPDAENKFKQINEAFQTIEHGEKQSFSNYQTVVDFDFNDILSDMFGNVNPFGRNKTQTKQQKNTQVNLKQTLSFKEAVLGCTKTINFTRRIQCNVCAGAGQKKIDNGCTTCKGAGEITQRNGNVFTRYPCNNCRGQIKFENCSTCQHEGATPVDIELTVKIPGGIRDGNILRLGGKGHFAGSSMMGVVYDDALLHLTVEPLEGLSLADDNSVVSHLTLSLKEALTGCAKSVNSIEGNKDIEIPRLTKHKDEIILPNLGANGVLPQRVIVNVEYPDKDIEELINFFNSRG